MKSWYYDAAHSIIGKLSRKLSNGMVVITDKVHATQKTQDMEHLTCFAGGMLALGAVHTEDKEAKEKFMQAGEGVARMCKEMYNVQHTKLHGENVKVDGDNIKNGNNQFLMRPEAVETWFYMYRITNDTKYRTWGWEYMQALNKWVKRKYGYDGLRDANQKTPVHDDVQQSWFLAETLKYLYLLFSPHDVIPLDQFVFNTEAHPFSLFDPATSYKITDPTNW